MNTCIRRYPRALTLTALHLIAAAGALAGSDFNNDGFDDLAIGVPGEGVGNIGSAGQVQVFYGTANGLSITAKADQVFHQDTAGVNQTAEGADHFGQVLATGDFNNDGFDDLAIGSPEEDIVSGGLTKDKAGVVNILYGSASGLTSAGDQDFVQGVEGVSGAVESNDRFGSALAVGDFDRDGCDDLAIGVPGDRANGVFDAGSVQIMRGTEGGLIAWRTLHQDSPGILGACEVGDGFGRTLAAADFGDDGFEDLAIGVVSEDVEINGINVQNCGMVQVVYGTGQGLTDIDQTWNQGLGNLLGSSRSNEFMGMALTAGNRRAMNGFSAAAFLAIHVSRDTDSPAGSGSVIILRASMGTDRLVSTDNQLITLDLVPGFDTPDAGDAFGSVMIMADFGKNTQVNNPTLDLAIGSPGMDVPASQGGNIVENAGAVFVIYDIGTNINQSKFERFAEGPVGGLSDTPVANDQFGSALAAVNFGKTFNEDLAIGVPGHDTNLGNVGAVHTVYSAGTQGLEATGAQFFTQNTENVEDQCETSDSFGASLGGDN